VVPFDIASLASELSDDPVSLGLSTLGDVAAAARLSDATLRRRRQPSVPRSRIKATLLRLGKMSSFLAGTEPWTQEAKILFTDPDFQVVDLDDPTWLALVSGLLSEVASNGINQSTVDAIQSLGDVPCSRGEELWGKASIDWGEVAQARGNWPPK